MDPVTAVGFVAAVVQLIDVTSEAISYINEVKDAHKERAKLAREGTYLLMLFTDLRYQVEDTGSTDPWFDGLLGAQGGPLEDFKSAMEDFSEKLKPATGLKKIDRTLRWPFEKKEIDRILSKIERLKTLISYALQKDHFKLSRAIKEEVGDVTKGLETMRINHHAEKIRGWLSAPDPSSNHNSAQKKKQPTTGEWFTQSREFTDWKTQPRSFIWLHGIPGCGKTILASTIIQDVIRSFQSHPGIAVAYFYFDYNNSEKQSTGTFLRSLIVQLSGQCPILPDFLQSAYSQSQNGQQQPTDESLELLICQMLKNFDNIYILVDALDECTDRESLLEFKEKLMGWKLDGLHLLTTSRKERDIDDSLQGLVTNQISIQSALVDADIRVHVLERISSDPKLGKWPVNIKKEIEDALTNGAKGMYVSPYSLKF